METRASSSNDKLACDLVSASGSSAELETCDTILDVSASCVASDESCIRACTQPTDEESTVGDRDKRWLLSDGDDDEKTSVNGEKLKFDDDKSCAAPVGATPVGTESPSEQRVGAGGDESESAE